MRSRNTRGGNLCEAKQHARFSWAVKRAKVESDSICDYICLKQSQCLKVADGMAIMVLQFPLSCRFKSVFVSWGNPWWCLRLNLNLSPNIVAAANWLFLYYLLVICNKRVIKHEPSRECYLLFRFWYFVASFQFFWMDSKKGILFRLMD